MFGLSEKDWVRISIGTTGVALVGWALIVMVMV